MKLKTTLVRAATAAALFAAIPLASVTAVATPANSAAAVQAQKLTNLKSRGILEIDRRLQNLSAASTKLDASTKLAAASRNALASQLSEQSGGLTTLKTKLAAETELAAARLDVQGIVTGYRVYALTLPKTRLVVATDRLTVATDRLTGLAVKMQTQLNAQKAAGKDVATLQAKLSTMKASTAAAQAKTTGLVDKLLAVTPADYNASRSVLLAHRETLRAAQVDIKSARNDAKAIADALLTTK